MPPRVPAPASTALLAAALLLAAPAARAQTFDFDGASFVGTPATLTSGGVSATFGHPGSPFFALHGYGRSTFAGLSGQVLADVTGDAFVSPLGIDFDVPLSAITLDFGLLSTPGTRLTLDAFRGPTLVGSAVALADVLYNLPEGTVAFGGAVFDRVVLSSDAADFAIDDVAVTVAPAVVPEPAPAGPVGAALGILAAAARGRRRRRR